MCDFVSFYLSEVPKINKDGKLAKRAKEIVPLFLDDDVWHTEAGKKLMEYSRSERDINGHTGIIKYFELSDETIRNLRRMEVQDFSTPDNFPGDIVKAIKKGKMVRMSKGDSNWKKLLSLLNKNCIREVRDEYTKYCAVMGKPNYKIDKIKFKNGTPENEKKEITEKLLRIERYNEGINVCSSRKTDCDINTFCVWSKTREGHDYWSNIHEKDIVRIILKPEESGYSVDLLKKQEEKGYWHDRIWTLFKSKKNRNPMWV